jgi:hypothetical protein
MSCYAVREQGYSTLAYTSFKVSSQPITLNFHYIFSPVILRIPPLPIALPNILLDSIRILSYKKILCERFDRLIMLKFFYPQLRRGILIAIADTSGITLGTIQIKHGGRGFKE